MTQTQTNTTTQATNVYSAIQIASMREWLSDCQWDDECASTISAMPVAAIVRAVKRHYDGGIAQFLIDINY